MTDDDLIRMAEKAGMGFYEVGWTTRDDPNNMYPECVYSENLERFAALVAAGERGHEHDRVRCGRERGAGEQSEHGEGADGEAGERHRGGLPSVRV